MRRVARLERRALPYIEEMRRYKEREAASLRERAFAVAANLALLILYGDPRIGEPLIYAWRRCIESPAWKACREKHPDYIGDIRRRGRKGFFGTYIAQYFRKYFLPELPGIDETEKLKSVFARAPEWLLWFTHADVIGPVLGLEIPDLSSKSRFARPDISMLHLPDGSFEWRELPDGAEDVFYAMQGEQLPLAANLTPRERMRALRLQEISE
jgi:hypothetical protein